MGDNLDRFLQAARDQIGDTYRFGAEVDLDSPDPSAFDSSELVEWAANQAGVKLPDGSWNQYRQLHDAGATVSMDQALQTKGALVFGFSSDPLESSDRPARAYVGISLGNGKVLDISERSGEVREMDPGDFYTHAAVIPELHTDPDSTSVDTDPPVLNPAVGPSQNPAEPEDGPVCWPDDEPETEPADGGVCYPDDEVPITPIEDPGLCYPDDQSTSYYESPVDASYDSGSYAAESSVSSDADFFDA